jgi:hypothetical protein
MTKDPGGNASLTLAEFAGGAVHMATMLAQHAVGFVPRSEYR